MEIQEPRAIYVPKEESELIEAMEYLKADYELLRSKNRDKKVALSEALRDAVDVFDAFPKRSMEDFRASHQVTQEEFEKLVTFLAALRFNKLFELLIRSHKPNEGPG